MLANSRLLIALVQLILRRQVKLLFITLNRLLRRGYCDGFPIRGNTSGLLLSLIKCWLDFDRKIALATHSEDTIALRIDSQIKSGWRTW